VVLCSSPPHVGHCPFIYISAGLGFCVRKTSASCFVGVSARAHSGQVARSTPPPRIKMLMSNRWHHCRHTSVRLGTVPMPCCTPRHAMHSCVPTYPSISPRIAYLRRIECRVAYLGTDQGDMLPKGTDPQVCCLLRGTDPLGRSPSRTHSLVVCLLAH
jgi:hypothetical protein